MTLTRIICTKFFAASMMAYSLSSRCAASGKGSRLVMLSRLVPVLLITCADEIACEGHRKRRRERPARRIFPAAPHLARILLSRPCMPRRPSCAARSHSTSAPHQARAKPRTKTPRFRPWPAAPRPQPAQAQSRCSRLLTRSTWCRAARTRRKWPKAKIPISPELIVCDSSWETNQQSSQNPQAWTSLRCLPRKSWCHAPQRLPHRPTLVRLAALVTCAVPVLPWRPARCFRVLPSWHPFCFLLCLIHASRTNGWNAHVTHPTGAGGSQARGTGKFQSRDSKGVRRKGFRRARP